MALVIRYRCHTCGAHVDATGHAAWVRCGYCRALVGYDWQAWFESQEYAAWLRSYPSLAPRFTDFQKDVDAAKAAAHGGRLDEAERHMRQAVDLVMKLTPQHFPTEVQHDKAYRERYIRYEVWLRLQWMLDPTLATLDAEVMAACRGLDFTNPLPTLEKVVDLVRRQFSRLESLPGAEDPDDMPHSSRSRITLSSLISAYLPMLTPEQRLSVLRSVHGVNNVLEVGTSATDEVGLYFDWQCPLCHLFSLQGRGATAVYCPGCLYKGPVSAGELALLALSTRCGSCGHAVTLPAEQMEVPCGACGAAVRRIARTGSVEHAYILEGMAERGHEPPRLPAEGVPGLPVTRENRLEHVLMGLARQANMYARIIQPSRYVEVVRRSLPELSDAARAARLERVAELSATQGGDDAARKLLAEAHARLLRA